MKARKRLWWSVFVAVCLLVAVVSLRSHRESEYAFLLRNHPKESLDPGPIRLGSAAMSSGLPGHMFRRFDFTCDPELVRASFPEGELAGMGTRSSDHSSLFQTPEGATGAFLINDEYGTVSAKPGGLSCAVVIDETRRSWFSRTLTTIRDWAGF